MHIISAHKYFWYRDGASNYAWDLKNALQHAHHAVAPFAMHHKKNMRSSYSKFFVSQMDLADPTNANLKEKLKFAKNMIYSCEAAEKMEKLLHHFPADVAHLHNIYHHISPSILPVLKKFGVPVVMTLHDYKLLCPNYTMFHHGRVHEENAKGLYFSCIGQKCMKDSYLQSAIVTAEMIWHHKIKKYYKKNIDVFIAPSKFIMDKCIEFGWDKRKFVHIPHPIDTTEFKLQKEDEGYVAYVGRLSEEKGLLDLVKAAKYIPNIPIKIVGEGPLRIELEEYCKEHNLENVVFTGFQTGKKLKNLIAGARMLVLPSIWYENYPISVLEAKAMGKIVIGSNIGGIPELLPKSMLVDPGKPKNLAKIIEKWYKKSKSERQKEGLKLHNEVKKINNPEVHLEAILGVYKSIT